MNIDFSNIVVASGNLSKVKEILYMIKPLGWKAQPQSDYFTEEVAETGKTFIENAILKARFAAQKTSLPAIADDSGLEVISLEGKPGIYSSRYAGNNATDKDNIAKLLQDMIEITPQKRTAHFYCAMVFVRFAEDPTPLIGLGKWQGEILTKTLGAKGFGYDPVFWINDLQKTAAQLLPEEKHKLSHRGKAINQLAKQLKQYYL